MILRTAAPPPRDLARSKLALEQATMALRLGDLGDAQRVLRERLLAAPEDADALVKLGEILRDQGHIDEAIVLFGRAIRAAPHAKGLHLGLARLFQQRGELQRALNECQMIGEPLRSSLEVASTEAALLGLLGRRDEEAASYRKLLRVVPDHAGVWMSLGNSLNYAGKRDEAVAAFRKAIATQPTFGEPWWSLANMKSYKFDDGDIAGMKKALRGKLTDIDRLHFHFALGKALEDRDRFEESFRHYSEGNRIRSASIPPAQRAVTQFVDRLIAAFDPAAFERAANSGNPSADPIFVLGLQRSGSTLIEQILASHPQIEGTAELTAMQQLWDSHTHASAASGLDPFVSLAHLEPERLKEIGATYVERTRPFRATDRPLFVDKQPANWMNVALIRLALPNAKIIDARRHPMACGFSNFKQHYATGVTFAYSQESIGRFYADYVRLMAHMDRVQPGKIHRVINEHLIDDPEGEVRRLLDYVGVPFDPACLDFHKTKRAIHTPSAEQVRRPINRDGVDYWRKYERWLDPMKQALGDALHTWDK